MLPGLPSGILVRKNVEDVVNLLIAVLLSSYDFSDLWIEVHVAWEHVHVYTSCSCLC